MTDSGLEFISKLYRVPARVGVRVEYAGCEVPHGRGTMSGTIVGSRKFHLLVEMDDGRELTLHPTWKIRYLNPELIQPECG